MILKPLKGSVRLSWLPSALIAIAAGGLPACGESDEPANAAGVYQIAITVGTPSALPKCASALGGTTAYVEKPSSLWSCNASVWLPIPCTNLLAGAVAYSSATKSLYACTSGQWTLVPLQQGAKGAPGATGAAGPAGQQGAPGTNGSNGSDGRDGADGSDGVDGLESLVKVTPEPEGLNCAIAGQRIDVGLDINGDGSLQTSEVQQTAYVCGGAASNPDEVVTPLPDTDATVSLSTSGVVVAPAHDFGGQVVGTLSPALNVIVSNGTTATIKGISADTGGAPYFVTNSTCNSLAPGASCTLSVKFAPVVGASTASSLVISGSAVEGTSSTSVTATLALTGLGLNRSSITVSPGDVDLGAVLWSGNSPPFPLTVTNSGQTSTGRLALASSSDVTFALEPNADTCTGTTLAAGTTCTFAARYVATYTGAQFGTVTVTDSASQAAVSLQGTGLPLGSPVVTPSWFDFGTRRSTDPDPKVTFTVINSNGAAAVAITAASGPDFAVTATSCGATLAAGQSCTLDVAFVAKVAGARRASLLIGSNAYAALRGSMVP